MFYFFGENFYFCKIFELYIHIICFFLLIININYYKCKLDINMIFIFNFKLLFFK